MKKVLAGMCLAASLAVLATPSFAGNDHGHDRDDHRGHVSKSVPEIDVAGTALAIALLGGIVAIARERRKKQ